MGLKAQCGSWGLAFHLHKYLTDTSSVSLLKSLTDLHCTVDLTSKTRKLFSHIYKATVYINKTNSNGFKTKKKEQIHTGEAHRSDRLY